MRRRHFDALRPICPVCRTSNGLESPLTLGQVVREEAGHIIEGALLCPSTSCLREYPIIDGIPLIIAGIRQYVADNLPALHARRDLSHFVETMLGDCCGPSSGFDQTRQQLSSYAWDHYGDLDPLEAIGEPRPGSMLRSLEQALQAAAIHAPPPEPVIDVGCAVGRGAFALAQRGCGLVLGVDLHYPMLRLASEILRSGRVRYARRQTGLVYERREFPVRFSNAENVDFWACDATALPLPAGTFSLAVNMNVLDCIHTPREFLVSLGRVLKVGGKAVLTCPYDWSPAATPLEAWLGGHSQRAPSAGSCETVLRNLLTPGAHPGPINTLKLIAEQDALPWHVRLHDRSTMTYKLHLVIAERVELTSPN